MTLPLDKQAFEGQGCPKGLEIHQSDTLIPTQKFIVDTDTWPHWPHLSSLGAWAHLDSI